jgi:hypothetical protein
MSDTTDRAVGSGSAPARRLQSTMAAVRISFTWLGVRKTLSREQKAEAAESFGAEDKYLSAAKKLLDTTHPAYRAVTTVRNQVTAYWRAMSLPYPEPGLRLIRQDSIDPFDAQMQRFTQDLHDAVQALDEHYAQLRQAAKDRLGRLYCASDYPPHLREAFALCWDFPAVQPPDYLLRLRPELYEQERSRIAARFEEAVKLAEQAFASEFADLLSHLTERLSSSTGHPKVFRDSAVGNLKTFFERFRQLNVRSNEQLDELIASAQKLLEDVEPQQLRDSGSLRHQIRSQLGTIRGELDELLVDRPRRRILRAPAQVEVA